MQTAATRPQRPLWPYALGAVIFINLVGFLAGRVSNSGYGNPWFDALEKPVFMPPGWAFPVAWTALYILLGVALALILVQPASRLRTRAITIFAAQMVLNFLWSPVFFGMRQPDTALGIIIVMLALACVAASMFARIRPLAGWLMLPYLAWLCFATALNYAIIQLNPGA